MFEGKELTGTYVTHADNAQGLAMHLQAQGSSELAVSERLLLLCCSPGEHEHRCQRALCSAHCIHACSKGRQRTHWLWLFELPWLLTQGDQGCLPGQVQTGIPRAAHAATSMLL